jgi:hypothetical protein
VVASRYVPGGGNDGLGAVRALVALGVTVLAKAGSHTRCEASTVTTDLPCNRDVLTQPITPRGGQILLEIVVRHPWLRRCEVRFDFRSTDDWRQGGYAPGGAIVPAAAGGDAVELEKWGQEAPPDCGAATTDGPLVSRLAGLSRPGMPGEPLALGR